MGADPTRSSPIVVASSPSASTCASSVFSSDPDAARADGFSSRKRATEPALAIVVPLLNGQPVVGDEQFDAGPPADDARLDVEGEPPPGRIIRSAVDPGGEVLSQ